MPVYLHRLVPELLISSNYHDCLSPSPSPHSYCSNYSLRQAEGDGAFRGNLHRLAPELLISNNYHDYLSPSSSPPQLLQKLLT